MTTVLDDVRRLVAQAEAQGRPRPGRDRLVKATGARVSQVRRALEAVRAEREQQDELGQQQQAAEVDAEQVSAEPAVTVVRLPGARLLAWAGLLFGAVMSVCGNVLAAWLPAAAAGANWSPGIAEQVGTAVWPIALLITVEVLTRVSWPAGSRWGLVRYGGTSVVALSAAAISYEHLRAVLRAWDYSEIGSTAGPLVLDGLMLVAGFALLAIAGAKRHQPSGGDPR